MKSRLIALGIALALLGGCETAPESASERVALEADAVAAVDAFKLKDPGMQRFFDGARAWAVFPSVGKGGLVVGGAYGKGVLYEGGAPVGHCDLSQGSIGLQIGGQAYREIIFFQTPEVLDRFKAGSFELSAQASAVLAQAGASTSTDYRNGVVVFTLPKGGLMYEASVAGQRFDYVPR